MTDYRWDETRAKAIRQLGETPAAPTEHDIIEAFKENPRHVVAVIDAVVAERASGAVLRSAWAVIRYRTTTSPSEDIIATDGHEKQLRIRQAEAWTRNAGLYCANESEALSELFDEGRPLYPWQDQGLETRMTELWHTNRPRGQHAEQECERRALERIELRAKLRAAKEAARPQLEPEYDDDPNWHHTPEPELEHA